MGCLESKRKDESPEEEPVYSWERADRPNPADFTIADKEGGTWGRLPGKVDGQQFILRNCKDSNIYIFDNSATITIDDCQKCKIFLGPIKGSVFFRNCKDCQCIVACQQFRCRDCKKMDVFLCCTSKPIIESSTGMKFGCYQYSYSELPDQFSKAGLSVFNNNWSEIHDFTPVPGENNWTLIPEDAKIEDYIPEPSTDEFSDVKIDTSPDKSVVPVTRGARRKNYDHSCLIVFFDDALDSCLRTIQSLKSEFSCDLIQTQKMSMSPEDAQRIFRSDAYRAVVEKGPVIGIEINGDNCVTKAQELLSSLQLDSSKFYVSSSASDAENDIDAFYKFLDMTMS